MKPSTATLPMRIGSERGRTEYVLASLMRMADGSLAAYPTAKGSGAVTAFAQADGFFSVAANTRDGRRGHRSRGAVDRRRAGGRRPCGDRQPLRGLDRLIGLLEQEGLRVKSLDVGSAGGLVAAKRGECDIAGSI